MTRRRSHRGLYNTVRNSFQPSTTSAQTAHSGGMRLLAALLASCVDMACSTTQHTS